MDVVESRLQWGRLREAVHVQSVEAWDSIILSHVYLFYV